MKKRLHVFDFDGTLFRSPDQPKDWVTPDWWLRPESLSPPWVPETPGLEWWVPETLAAARQSVSDPDTYTVLLTGRNEGVFGPRVRDLLNQVGITFSEVYCAQIPEVQKDKLRVISRILDEHPTIHYVEMWEDQVGLVSRYRQAINDQGRNVFFHIVNVPPQIAGTSSQRVATRWLSAV